MSAALLFADGRRAFVRLPAHLCRHTCFWLCSARFWRVECCLVVPVFGPCLVRCVRLGALGLPCPSRRPLFQ